jgi:hypothetical protein
VFQEPGYFRETECFRNLAISGKPGVSVTRLFRESGFSVTGVFQGSRCFREAGFSGNPAISGETGFLLTGNFHNRHFQIQTVRNNPEFHDRF